MAKTAKKQDDAGHQSLDCFKLKAIRLVGYGANALKLGKEDCPLEIEICMSGTANQNEDKTRLVVDMTFAVNFKEKPAPKEEVLANFNGKYQLVYSSEFPCNIEERQVGHFIKGTSVKDLWPYWRELVHETSARMGMPVSPLPYTVNFTDVTVIPTENPR